MEAERLLHDLGEGACMRVCVHMRTHDCVRVCRACVRARMHVSMCGGEGITSSSRGRLRRKKGWRMMEGRVMRCWGVTTSILARRSWHSGDNPRPGGTSYRAAIIRCTKSRQHYVSITSTRPLQSRHHARLYKVLALRRQRQAGGHHVPRCHNSLHKSRQHYINTTSSVT